MRTDKKKSIDKVAAALAKNPLATEREIEQETGVSKSAVNRAKSEVGQVGAKDQRIQALTDLDFEVIQLSTQENKRRLKDDSEKTKISPRDLAYIGDVSARRYQTFAGEVTDDQGGLKFNEMTDEQLDRLIAKKQEEQN